MFSITDYWSLYEVARLSSIIAKTKTEDKIPIVIISNQSDMEKQRKISKTQVSQFLNDLGKPVFQTSAADNYDSVRTAFDEASRLVYKWKFALSPRKSRSRSGSFMDPLREAFIRHTTKSASDTEIPQRLRSASSAGIQTNDAQHVPSFINNFTMKAAKKQLNASERHKTFNNTLELPQVDIKRTRSYSFA